MTIFECFFLNQEPKVKYSKNRSFMMSHFRTLLGGGVKHFLSLLEGYHVTFSAAG